MQVCAILIIQLLLLDIVRVMLFRIHIELFKVNVTYNFTNSG